MHFNQTCWILMEMSWVPGPIRYDWSSCGNFFAGVNCEIACRTPYEGRGVTLVSTAAVELNSQVNDVWGMDGKMLWKLFGARITFLGCPWAPKNSPPSWSTCDTKNSFFSHNDPRNSLVKIDWIRSRWSMHISVFGIGCFSWRTSPVSFLSEGFMSSLHGSSHLCWRLMIIDGFTT